MATKRITRITVERDRFWIIRQCGSLTRTRCESCGADVEFVSLEQAITLTGKSADEIQQSVLMTKVHTLSGEDKGMRICLQSLLEDVPVPQCLKAPQGS